MVDWAYDHTTSAIWSCLAAHAAVLHTDGIEREPAADKVSGIFECETVALHPMTIDAAAGLRVPHSRYNGLSEQALAASGYRILTRAGGAGVDMFARQEKSFHIFLQGHPEYEARTLLREYRRDVCRYLKRERENYPALPLNYFDDAAAAIARGFRERAYAERAAGADRRFPDGASPGRARMPVAAVRRRHLREMVRISQRAQVGPAPVDHAAAAGLARLADQSARSAGRRVKPGLQFAAAARGRPPAGVYILFGSGAF